MASGLQQDPTRTTMLRRKFVAEMYKRFRTIRGLVRKALIDKDVLGLIEESPKRPVDLQAKNTATARNAAPGAKAFAFERSAQKVAHFQEWFDGQVEEGLLEVVDGAPWTDTFVDSAYKKGHRRAWTDVNTQDVSLPEGYHEVSKEAYLRETFAAPEMIEKIELLQTRTFENLKNISADMSSKLGHELASGLADGRNPREIARSINKAIGGIGKKRARTLARTEIIHAHAEGQLDSFEKLGIDEVGAKVEWLTHGDLDTVCSDCAALETEVFTIEKARGMLPKHPNCFVSSKVPVYTSDGWTPIGKIKVGDKVLTHEGRFRKVIQTHRHWVDEVKTVRFTVEKGDANKAVRVTGEHPILTSRGWVAAKDLQENDKIIWLCSKCESCGESIHFGLRYCNQKCQWKNEEHRKNVARKNKISMDFQYEQGLRNGKEITKKANAEMRRRIKKGDWTLLEKGAEWRMGENNPAKRPEVRKKISESKKGDKNPMKCPEIVARAQKKMRETLKLHPERIGNRVLNKMRWEGRLTYIEQRMRESLLKVGLSDSISQYPVSKYTLDFAFPDQKLGVECDGERWHKDKEKEERRQKELEVLGWEVIHFTGSQIKDDSNACAKKVKRILMNHSGQYRFEAFKITSISYGVSRRRYLYNLSVEKDESYIAKGCVVHNCRCAWIPYVPPETRRRTQLS